MRNKSEQAMANVSKTLIGVGSQGKGDGTAALANDVPLPQNAAPSNREKEQTSHAQRAEELVGYSNGDMRPTDDLPTNDKDCTSRADVGTATGKGRDELGFGPDDESQWG